MRQIQAASTHRHSLQSLSIQCDKTNCLTKRGSINFALNILSLFILNIQYKDIHLSVCVCVLVYSIARTLTLLNTIVNTNIAFIQPHTLEQGV